MEPTLQEIQSAQGTRLEEAPPWMSYAAEMDTGLEPQLAKQVEEYAQHRYDNDQTSSENKEELHRQREINQDLSKQYQWIHPSEYQDEGPRIGKIIHSSEFITTLRKIAGNSGRKFFYRQHPQPGKATLLYQMKTGPELEVACWAQLGYMPEYSIMRFDRYGVPLDERLRGWRTCTLQMILKEIITEEEADKAFGKATGPACNRYRATLYAFRNRGNGWEREDTK